MTPHVTHWLKFPEMTRLVYLSSPPGWLVPTLLTHAVPGGDGASIASDGDFSALRGLGSLLSLRDIAPRIFNAHGKELVSTLVRATRVDDAPTLQYNAIVGLLHLCSHDRIRLAMAQPSSGVVEAMVRVVNRCVASSSRARMGIVG